MTFPNTVKPKSPFLPMIQPSSPVPGEKESRLKTLMNTSSKFVTIFTPRKSKLTMQKPSSLFFPKRSKKMILPSQSVI